jgi:hypothetical protein
MLAAFPGPVQLAQAAAKCFNLLFVRVLLALGQFQGLEHCLHVVQRASERLDDLSNLFDCLLNGHWGRGSQVAPWRQGSLPLGGDGFRNGLNRLSRFFRGWRQLLD